MNTTANTLGLRVVGVRQNGAMFTLDRKPGNSRVVAAVDVPGNTFVAAYPGWVYPQSAFEQLVQAGKRGSKYSVTMFAVKPDGHDRAPCGLAAPVAAGPGPLRNVARVRHQHRPAVWELSACGDAPRTRACVGANASATRRCGRQMPSSRVCSYP